MKQVNPAIMAIVGVMVMLLIGGCDTFDLAEQYQARSVATGDTGLTISPVFAVVRPDESVEFSASGGTSPYAFSLSDTAAGIIDEHDGTYVASQLEGEFSVTVTDDVGKSVDAGIFVSLPREYSLSPSVLTVETGEEHQFSVYGGAAPYEFTVVVGAIGTFDPDTPGLFTAGEEPAEGTVRVTDKDGRSSSSQVYVREPGSTALELAVEAGTTEQESAVRLFPSGGAAPYSYSVTAVETVYAGGDSGVGYVVNDSYQPGDFVGVVEITVRDSDSSTVFQEVKVLPATPANFAVEAVTGAKVRLTWDYGTSGVTGFRVERRQSDTTFGELVELSASDPVARNYDYTDETTINNQFYEYRITAVTSNASYDSAFTVPRAVLAQQNP
ncbi:MAG: fibronectin type III domain-containing protein [Alkalispirochaeta sp.]